MRKGGFIKLPPGRGGHLVFCAYLTPDEEGRLVQRRMDMGPEFYDPHRIREQMFEDVVPGFDEALAGLIDEA